MTDEQAATPDEQVKVDLSKIDLTKIELPPPPTGLPMQTHVYEELPAKGDNRGIAIVERRTIDGTEPAGFVRFIGRVTIALPVPNPNSPQGFSEVSQLVQAPIDAQTWQEAFAKADAVLNVAAERTAKKHMDSIRGQSSLISVARRMPQQRGG